MRINLVIKDAILFVKLVNSLSDREVLKFSKMFLNFLSYNQSAYIRQIFYDLLKTAFS